MKFAGENATAFCAAVMIGVNAWAAVAIARSGQDKMGPDHMGKMDVHEESYTGCVEAAKTPRTYVLTHVAAANDHMGKDAMAKDSMGMSKSAMSPTTLVISSKVVDLSKQVGRKVTVSGSMPAKMDSMGKDSMGKDSMGTDAQGPAFTIKTLKVVSSSCK